MQIDPIVDGCFCIRFSNILDIDRLWEEGSWNFNNHPIPILKWKPNLQPSDFRFEVIKFWIHFYNLPWKYYTESTARCLCKVLGTFKMVDGGEYSDPHGKYLRVRVGIPIDKPLIPVIRIRDAKKGWKKIYVRYECLNNFFYYCVGLGHGDNNCKEKLRDSKSSIDVEEY